MAQFETSRFGALEVAEDRIINFPDGLLGFPDLKRYILMDYKDTPLKWLQAVDDPDVAFIVTEPAVLVPDYKVRLDPATKQYLRIENDEDLAVLMIVRVEGEKVVANLQGPLFLNASRMTGAQIVVDRALERKAGQEDFPGKAETVFIDEIKK